MLKDVLEDVVLPYVRETYACETCVVGEILIRRWDNICEYITFQYMMLGNCLVYIQIHRSNDAGSWLVVAMVLYVLDDFFDSLLNRGRYLPEERRTHNLHFDSHAFATVVLGLTSPEA